ncbi:MAG TPA: hypothetical protein PKY77_20115 [Phycisphaerae bacterium]|nr:hypothetical protein [Phycisphaerae bacterium]HRY69235.1 hypothetical protein [Phycisphaerae bacterium]HSA26197.1 hypothetical protein [Phycisphaerae bacterium]
MTERTTLFLAVMSLSSLLVAGCAMLGTPPQRDASPEPISAPQDEPSPNEKRMSPARYAGSESPADDQDPQVAKLTAQVQKFSARFPVTDLDRLSAGHLEDQPSAPPAAASPASQPAPVHRAASGKARARTVTAPPPDPMAAPDPVVVEGTKPTIISAASPMSPPSVETEAASDAMVPNRPANAEATASPKPQKIDAPPPTALASGLRVEIMDIRPGAVSPPVPEHGQPSANRPTPASDSGMRTADISSLITRLEEIVRKSPQHLDDQLRLRMLYVATGQTDKATASVKNVDAMQGEILTALFKAVAATQEVLKDPTAGAASALAAAGELNRLVGEQSPIVIPKLALVTRVDSFGNYQAVNPPVFPAGHPVHVYLYAEVANFRSQPSADGRLRTLLGAKIEVFDNLGKVIWQRGFPQIEDRALSPRRDFFVPLEIKLPPDTPPGGYVVKVTIEDKLGATTDQQRLSFTIGNP